MALYAGRFQLGKQRGVLPVVQVSGVSTAVLEIVLEFIYTDLLPQLPEPFLSEDGADELFDAADRYLIFSMKVGHTLTSCSYWSSLCVPFLCISCIG